MCSVIALGKQMRKFWPEQAHFRGLVFKKGRVGNLIFCSSIFCSCCSFKEEREQIALVAHYKKSNGSNLLFMKEQLLFLKWGFVLSDEKKENWTFFLTLFCFVKVSKSLFSQEQHEPVTLLPIQVYSLLVKSDESYSLLLPI